MIMQKYKRICASLVTLVTIFLIMSGYALADSGTASTNEGSQNYDYDLYAKPINSYMVANDDNTYTRVEYIKSGKLIVEKYDADFNCTKMIELPVEMSLFGGFFSGKDYNFFVFGERNPSQSSTQEILKIVKYSKDWNRISSVGLSDCNTTAPFEAGTLRMTEYGNMLYIRSSHLMYKSSDGLNHQSNLSLSISIPDMKITDGFWGIMNSTYGYASHSFNQFILTSGDTLAAVDHGDAYPRSAVLFIYSLPAGQDKFLDPGKVKCIELMPFEGAVGDNNTGASLGGFEVSDSSYIVAGNSVVQDKNYGVSKTKNIFLTVTPISNPTSNNTQIKWLTNYSENGQKMTSTPHLVKISSNNFAVIWSEENNIKYIFIDENGNKKTDIKSMPGNLSDCKPIVNNDKIIWYVTKNSSPIFYTINLNGDLTQQNITVSGLSDKTYGDAPFSLSVTADPNSGLSNFSFKSSDTGVAEISPKGEITINGAGTADITVKEPGNSNYAPFTWTQKLSVKKADITVQAENKSKKVGDPDPQLTTVILSGKLYKNDVLKGAPVRDRGEDIGLYNINQGTLSHDNYNIIFVPGSFEITGKNTQNIIVNGDIDKTYGDAPYSLSITPDPSAKLSNFTFNSSDTNVVKIDAKGKISIHGSGTATITINEPGNANYAPFTWTNTFTVKKAALNVSADNKSTTYGDSLPKWTVTYSGFVNGDSENSLDTKPSVALGTSGKINAGKHSLIISGGNSKNYEFNYVNGTLNVSKKNVTVSALSVYDKKYQKGNKSAEVNSSGCVINGAVSGDDINVNSGTLTAEFENDSIGNNKKVTIKGILLSGKDKDNYNLTSSTFTTTGNIKDNITAQDVAKTITSIKSPSQGASRIDIPAVPDGFTISIKSSSNSAIDVNGNIYDVDKNTNVELVFTVKKTTDNTTADTKAIKITVLAPTKYKINAVSGTGGKVSGSGTYVKNTNVILKATPDYNYAFDGWYENNVRVSGAGSSYSFLATTDRTLTARFSYINSSGNGGSTSGSSGNTSTTTPKSASINIKEAQFIVSSPKDISVTLTLNTRTLNNIKNGNEILKKIKTIL